MLRSHQIKSLKDNEGITPDGKVFTTTLSQRMNVGKAAMNFIPLSKEEQVSNRGHQIANKLRKREKNRIKKKSFTYGGQSKRHGVAR